eukprot:3124563-Ditylum_brightwellii.AAC.1
MPPLAAKLIRIVGLTTNQGRCIIRLFKTANILWTLLPLPLHPTPNRNITRPFQCSRADPTTD